METETERDAETETETETDNFKSAVACWARARQI